MKVVLGTFACSGIEAHLGSDIGAGVETALHHYAAREVADRPPSSFERPVVGPWLGREGAGVELTLGPELAATLERLARRAGGIPAEQVVTHAVLAYLAELDRDTGQGPREPALV